MISGVNQACAHSEPTIISVFESVNVFRVVCTNVVLHNFLAK